MRAELIRINNRTAHLFDPSGPRYRYIETVKLSSTGDRTLRFIREGIDRRAMRIEPSQPVTYQSAIVDALIFQFTQKRPELAPDLWKLRNEAIAYYQAKRSSDVTGRMDYPPIEFEADFKQEIGKRTGNWKLGGRRRTFRRPRSSLPRRKVPSSQRRSDYTRRRRGSRS